MSSVSRDDGSQRENEHDGGDYQIHFSLEEQIGHGHRDTEKESGRKLLELMEA